MDGTRGPLSICVPEGTTTTITLYVCKCNPYPVTSTSSLLVVAKHSIS